MPPTAAEATRAATIPSTGWGLRARRGLAAASTVGAEEPC